jgi:hypothetical protein
MEEIIKVLISYIDEMVDGSDLSDIQVHAPSHVLDEVWSALVKKEGSFNWHIYSDMINADEAVDEALRKFLLDDSASSASDFREKAVALCRASAQRIVEEQETILINYWKEIHASV